MPSLSLALLETLFVLSLAASLPSSSGLSSPYPDIITLPLTPDIITLLQHPAEKELTPLPVPGYGFGHRKRWFKNPIHATIALTVEGALLARSYCPVVGIRTRSLIFGRQEGF